MCMASDPSTKSKVSDAFQEASKIGMNMVRTWAFSDGGRKPLQTSPGVYNEDMFKGLDFVISEAKKHGLHLILSLVNDFGGRSNHLCMGDDECQSDLSGKTLQEWIVEMAEIGLEGFYGESMPEKKQNNPGYEVGTDFISNNRINNVDFATIHLYPDQCQPLLIAEFGKSSWSTGYTVKARDDYIENIFNMAYESARNDGSCSGTTFWQVMAEGMDNWCDDGYQVVLEQSPSNAVVYNKI
ncbi:hypothetical protein L1987_04400 [Smallanthus sonchifolius]|uniref:Uncharacterized protein n=1 Tax=Smallanthus sonchifolius TaxID=185202 RepID=A0ACB9KDF3_9ASTR|nr:hypothetical protein L1987_04400 [Smallanthus sonchifolius]